MMMKQPGILALIVLAGAGSATAGAKELDFDVHTTPVALADGAGSVDVVTQIKVQAVPGEGSQPVLLSEATMFFPAPAKAILAALSSEAGIGRMVPFASKVGTAPVVSGHGLELAITIDPAKLAREMGRILGGPGALQDGDVPAEPYDVLLNSGTEQMRSRGAATVHRISFVFQGRMIQEARGTIDLYEGTDDATMVVVSVRSSTTIARDTSERVLLAKRLLRESASLIQRALGR